MLSFNCADLILVTYLVTENTVYHTPSQHEYSLDSVSQLWRHTNVHYVYGFVVFLLHRE